MSKIKFEIVDVVAGYDDTDVLNGVSLKIPAGVFVIVGPSGSGKSTLLRLLNRLSSPRSGKIFYENVPIEDYEVNELRRKVGMVFQKPILFDGTVADNIRYARSSITDEKVRELLELVGLPSDYFGRRWDELSIGESQRVCLARTLATEPDVLLLDEPTSALDPTATGTIEELMLSFVPKISLVWVTHLMEKAERIGGQSAMIYRGKIHWAGSTKELKFVDDKIVRKFVSGKLK